MNQPIILTLAAEDVVRVCPFLDRDLSLPRDRGRDGGSELGDCIVGIVTMGSKLAPGLADREMRGQGIATFLDLFSPPANLYIEQQACCR